MKKILIPLLFCLSSTANAGWKPYCYESDVDKPKVIAYLGADNGWSIDDENLTKLKSQLQKVDVVNYAFVRLSKDVDGNIVLNLSRQDVLNLKKLKQLRQSLPILLAIGGWGEREGFDQLVASREKRAIFIASVKRVLSTYHLDGIDIDWENELLASTHEVQGVASLIRELKQAVGGAGYCVSNAVPGTEAYWVRYPHASLWASDVDWTTIMSYDHYGTFGPRTEHGSALYEFNRVDDQGYPYPTASGNRAVNHYYQQGLSAKKMILGVPFYCHSYYISNANIADNRDYPGLHDKVIDPNINSQVSYESAWQQYGQKLFEYEQNSAARAGVSSFYGLIQTPGVESSRFMSCDSPKSIKTKMEYVKGRNDIGENKRTAVVLGGVSFWNLQQDLPYEHPMSLLRAIKESL